MAFSIKFTVIGSSHNKRYSAFGKTTTLDCDNYIKLISLCHNNIRQRLEIITMRQLVHTKIFIVIYVKRLLPCRDVISIIAWIPTMCFAIIKLY